MLFRFGSIEPNSALLHLNDFYEFCLIELNSKKHRNIGKVRIRFGSVRYSKKILEFHCTTLILLFMRKFRVKIIYGYRFFSIFGPKSIRMIYGELVSTDYGNNL
jgi:hypothetical protein